MELSWRARKRRRVRRTALAPKIEETFLSASASN